MDFGLKPRRVGGVIIESRLLGDNKEKVKMGDRVKARYEQTHNPDIKLPCFELAG